tara:strand:- start:1329 stop:1550 length:222 start_codon:yes stop_codon:yes gene_type:complete
LDTADNVNFPAHYTQGIECFDYINSHSMSYAQGAVCKYITRYKHKGTALEDLQKAEWYLRQLILEEEAREKLK